MANLRPEDQQRLDALNAKRAELLAERVAALKQELTRQLPDATTTVGEAFRPEQLVDALLGRRWRMDRPGLGVQRPPALGVAVDHPAPDAVQPGVLQRLVGRTEDQGLTTHAQDGRSGVQQDHAVARWAVRHGGSSRGSATAYAPWPPSGPPHTESAAIGAIDAPRIASRGEGRCGSARPAPVVTAGAHRPGG